jgi:hypothetical protein
MTKRGTQTKIQTPTDKIKGVRAGYIDTTKTGPLSYRELQQALNLQDASREYYESDQGRGIQATSSGPAGARKVAVTEDYDLGASSYDPGYFTSDTEEQYQDIRANNQPFYAQAAAGIVKGIGLAGTTFVDGTVGLAVGLIEAIASGNFSKIWDNEVTQYLDSLNRDMETYLPNYYTRDQQENPMALRNLFGGQAITNTIFDQFVKNLGFTVGAAYSGGVYTKAISGLMEGIGGIMGATKALKIAKGVEEGLGTAERMKKYAQIGARAFDMKSGVRATKALTGSIFSAIAEGTTEAVSNSNDWHNLQNTQLEDKANADKQALIDQYKDNIFNGMSEEEAMSIYQAGINEINQAVAKTKANIEQNRSKMGTADLLANIPILTIDNFFMFGKQWAGGFKAARNNSNTITRATKEARREAKEAWKRGDKSVQQNLNKVLEKVNREGYTALTEAEKSLIEEAPNYILGKKAAALKGVLQGPLREGNEEMAQAAAAEISGDYYKKESDYIYDSSIHPESTQKLADSTTRFWDSVKEGLSDTYGSWNRYNEFFIGALTGALGSPTFGRKNNSTDQTWLGRGKLIGLTGGAKVEYRDYMANRDERDEIAKQVTRVLKDPKTVDRVRHLAAQIKIDGDKKAAVRLNDKKLYKDAETAALFEDIMYLKRAGKMDMFDRMLQSIEGSTDEELQQIKDATMGYISAYDNNVKEHTNTLRNAQINYQQQLYRIQDAEKQLQDAIDSNASQDIIDTLNDRVLREKSVLEEMEKEISSARQALENAKVRESNPYIHTDGTIFTDDEIREELGKKVEKSRKLVKDISDTQDKLDIATSEVLTDEQLATMTYLEVAKRDWEARGGEIMQSLYREFEESGIIDSIAKRMEANINKIKERFGEKAIPKKFQQAIKSIENLRDNLHKILAKPEKFVPYLVQNLEIEAKDVNGNDITVDSKDTLLSSLKAAIEMNTMYSEADKEARLQDIEDLSKIVDSYREYDNKLAEFMKNPGKIEVQHRAADEEAIKKAQKALYKKITKEMDFNSPDSIKSIYTKYKKDIEDNGGLAKFLASLSSEQREAVKKVINDDDANNALQEALRKVSNNQQVIQGAAKALAEGAPNLTQAQLIELSKDSSSLDEFIAKAASAAVEGIEDPRLQEATRADLEEKMKVALNKALMHASRVLSEAQRAKESALNKALKAEEEGTRPSTEGGPSTAAAAAATEPEAAAVRAEQHLREENNNKKQKTVEDLWKGGNKESRALIKQERKPGYERRRQFTEYYIYGVDGQTLEDYYKANPSKIPAGVSKKEWLDYVKRVSDFLQSQGAFTFVSGINKEKGHHLEAGDSIYFQVEESISTPDNPVVVIKTESGQVIGTIRSQYEFDSYDADIKTGGKQNKAIEAQRELYNAVVAKHKAGDASFITTTVESLQKGSLPIASHNSSLKQIFGNNVPIIGIVQGNQGNTVGYTIETMSNTPYVSPSAFGLQRGQVFVLIPTNTGVSIPAMLYSTPIADMADDDWYISQAVDAFMKMLTDSNISEGIRHHKQNFLKWLPIGITTAAEGEDEPNEDTKNSKGLFVGVYNKQDGSSWTPVESLDDATHIIVKFNNTKGEKMTFTWKITDDNGNRISDDALKNIIRKFIKKTAKANDIQANIDKRRLNDTEYMSHMMNYYYTNLMVGSRGQHSMNDGFLYAPTSIEQQYEARGVRQQTPQPGPQNGTKTVLYNGEEYTVDMASVVRNSKGEVVDEDTKNKVLEAMKPIPTPTPSGQSGTPTPTPTNTARGRTRSGVNLTGNRSTRGTTGSRTAGTTRTKIGGKKASTSAEEEAAKKEAEEEAKRKAAEKEARKEQQRIESIADEFFIEVAKKIFNGKVGTTLDDRRMVMLIAYALLTNDEVANIIVSSSNLSLSTLAVAVSETYEKLIAPLNIAQRETVVKYYKDESDYENMKDKLDEQCVWENLDKEDKDFLSKKSIGEKQFNALPIEDKLKLLSCFS